MWKDDSKSDAEDKPLGALAHQHSVILVAQYILANPVKTGAASASEFSSKN